MSGRLSNLLARLSPGQLPYWYRWAYMWGAFALMALLFHPVFLLIGGVIGFLTALLALWGGMVLGRRDGVIYGFLTGLASVPLWIMEYGVSPRDNISGPFIAAGVALAGGYIGQGIERVRRQAQVLKTLQLELMQVEKMALFGDVASGVAHEINQPLAVIGMAAEIARSHLENGHADKALESLRSIMDQVQRAGGIVSRLKSTGRHLGEEVPREYRLNDILDEVLGQFEMQFTALGITLETSLSPELPPLTCRRGEIQQVFLYLLLNARDAVDVTGTKNILVKTSMDQGELVAEVIDSGIGMKEEMRKHIFEPFFTTKEVGVGSGLGLSICYRILKSHGGSISVASAPGQGSHFTLRLPRHMGATAKLPPAAELCGAAAEPRDSATPN